LVWGIKKGITSVDIEVVFCSSKFIDIVIIYIIRYGVQQMKVYLDQETRDGLLNKLSEALRNFLKEHVKSGKKTEFANFMAKQKGMVLPQAANEREVELLLDEWILIDYIDNGYVSEETPCACGRPLRYQYIVKHKQTQETRRFGITHFEEHTGLPANIVKGIKDGFERIDYELDELLLKLSNGWNIKNEIPFIPDGLELPKDIKHQFSLQLPLLDSQLSRLKELINESLERPVVEQIKNKTVHFVPNKVDDSPQLCLFNDEVSEEVEVSSGEFLLSDDLQNYILEFLNSGAESARIICELLIKNHGAPKDRYNTGKPKIYGAVCIYLDSLHHDNIVQLKTLSHADRIYQLVK
jgi:hypothetical protein